jgi:hypothetical protein|tara:strand:- start:297 stop:1121 length:825 start_codon:yes stop_codon:yes gene_type:complete
VSDSNPGKPELGVQDSVVQGDVHLGDKVINNTSIEYGRRQCAFCETSGNHTFFKCNTTKCENEYCEYCEHKSSKKCKICFDFENTIESKEMLLQKTIDAANEYVESTSNKLKAEKDEIFDYSSLISKQRTSYIHFSNNVQLIGLIVLLSFSDFILNISHAFEVVSYSFISLVIYNYTSSLLRENQISIVYLVDIVVVILVLVISLVLSHYFSGYIAILFFVAILVFFLQRLIYMLNLINRKSYFSDRQGIDVDFSAVSCIICLVYYVVVHFAFS